MASNPLRFSPPLHPSTDDLAQRVVDARDALNAIGTVEGALHPERVEGRGRAYDRSLHELAAALRALGDHGAAEAVLLRVTGRPDAG